MLLSFFSPSLSLSLSLFDAPARIANTRARVSPLIPRRSVHERLLASSSAECASNAKQQQLTRVRDAIAGWLFRVREGVSGGERADWLAGWLGEIQPRLSAASA